MNASNISIIELREEIQKQLHHSYLKEFLPQPVIDDDKLMILSTIIEQSNLNNIEKKNYIITTMLVQIALDTHDLVTQSDANADSDLDRKKRQLTVLAGDYYSGLYYYLLSKLDDIPMIQTLASAIKEINEKKMIVYYREFDSIQEFLASLKELESILFLRVAKHLKLPNVKEIIENWFVLKRLTYEKNTYLSKGNSQIIELLTKGPALHISEGLVMDKVDSYVDKYRMLVEEALEHLPNSLQMVKLYLSAALYESQEESIQVMEEG